MVRLGEESLDQILVWDIFWLKLVFPIRVSNYLGIIGNPILFKNSPAEVKKKIIGKMLQGGLSIGTRCCRAGCPVEGCHRGDMSTSQDVAGARCLVATCHRALIITQVGEN